MQQSKSKRFRYIIFGTIGLLLAASAGIATVFILQTISPSAEKKAQPVATVAPQDIVDSYSADEAIPVLSTDDYQLSNNIGQGAVTYKAGGHDYSVSVPTDAGVVFQAISRTQTDKTDSVIEQTTAFMQTKGMHVVTQSTQEESDTRLNTTYENASLVCQLRVVIPDEISTASYTLSCVDKAAVNKEYETVEQLMNLYEEVDTLGSFTEAIRMITSEDNLSAATVGLTKMDKSFTMLLFVSVDDIWQFVANLTDGDGNGEQSNGKYVPSEALTAAYEDPTYGDFLKKHF
ncbi:MAG TPA: hypothetical protein VFS65_01415 [Candidatus Saccharimonadales bacterium]|nr:hypothetical protein [Candidatus Saccharimonadales bacterium]